ncbi:hypothetical protein VSH64_24770 [Amycolatopsis rhabdoformis]|uniref:Uncharacterized protein n=1 Tax=Amycolatopsis rhabdoformis TaxID=1448059 RepID=A0ABZ1HWV3_9PSEU|nr:hypothetical protein [Amycolatopsis rhabdoformis]WSE26091.1 hypothetical protein VSH64_24770 [Amycolatopsis rhabdoformis]
MTMGWHWNLAGEVYDDDGNVIEVNGYEVPMTICEQRAAEYWHQVEEPARRARALRDAPLL